MALAPSPSVPEVIGPYTIVRPLGGSASGVEGFVGRAPVTSAPAVAGAPGARGLVVIERVLRARSSSADFDAFTARARGVATLRQPNVPRVIEIISDEVQTAVVSDFILGERLERLDALAAAGEKKPLSLGARIRVLLDVCSALAAIHALRVQANGAPATPGNDVRVVHGDVTPTSILAGVDGAGRILRVHRKPFATKARVGIVDAQTGYSAPEILLGDGAADVRADVYSLGVVLWEALSNKRLFTQGTLAEMLSRQLAGDLPLATIPADAPWAAPLVEIAATALAVDPNSRFSTVTSMATTMRDVAAKHLPPALDVAGAIHAIAQDAIGARSKALARPVAASADVPRESKIIPSARAKAPPPPPPRPGASRPGVAPKPPPPKPVAPPAGGATTAVMSAMVMPPEALKTQTMAAMESPIEKVEPPPPPIEVMALVAEPVLEKAPPPPPMLVTPPAALAPAPPEILAVETDDEALFAPPKNPGRRVGILLGVVGLCVVILAVALVRAAFNKDDVASVPDGPSAPKSEPVATHPSAPNTPMPAVAAPTAAADSARKLPEPSVPDSPPVQESSPAGRPAGGAPHPGGPKPRAPRPRSTYEPMGI